MIAVSNSVFLSIDIPAILKYCGNVRQYQIELLSGVNYDFLDFMLACHTLNRLAARAMELAGQLPESEDRTNLMREIRRY